MSTMDETIQVNNVVCGDLCPPEMTSIKKIQLQKYDGYEDEQSLSCVSDYTYENPHIINIYEQLNEDEIIDAEEMMNELFEEYISENIHKMCNPQFHENMVEWVSTQICDFLIDAEIITEESYDDICSWTNEIAHVYFTISEIPPRYHHHEMTMSRRLSPERISNKLEWLKNVYQPPQKSVEWYQTRHQLLTASNLWKALGNETQFNSLVYEKCKPFNIELAQAMSSYGNSNNNNPMNWGIRYEPVTIMLYEQKYQTKIGDFGCITHPTYHYIGASPDGINIYPQSNLYGRMIEVKNIVNREINGNPSEAYWIQMQIQMEVCDLDECDFIETRFLEFDNEIDFYTFSGIKGVILYFIPRIHINQHNLPNQHKSTLSPKYIYMPLDVLTTQQSIEKWKETQKKLFPDYVLYHTHYWKLDEFSCVLVLRNRAWFQSVVSKIVFCYETIQKEKEEGYDHRAPQSRKPPPVDTQIKIEEQGDVHLIKNMPNTKHTCLVKLDTTT